MATHREGNEQEKLGNPYGTAKYSTFPLHKKHATTEPFGMITPFEFRNIITGDEHDFGGGERIETYTLAAPLMSVVWKTREWYYVPRMAILPNAWNKIYTQPRSGEDIDATIAGTSVSSQNWSNFLSGISGELKAAITEVDEATATAEEAGAKTIIEGFERLIKAVIINEYIFSYGSLLNRAGCKMAALWKSQSGKYKNFDTAFDAFIASISYGFKVTWDGNHGSELQYTVRTGTTANKLTNELSIREFLTKARDNLNFEILTIISVENGTTGLNKTELLTSANATSLNTEKAKWVLATEYNIASENTQYSQPVDIARLWAYQLICAEVFTDDDVDYIYNADIYREYIGDLVKSMITNIGDTINDFGFTLNGIWTSYDWLSAAGFGYCVANIINQEIIPYDYITALFNMNRSLKYKDYFTGARTSPMIPGDNTVSVVNNKFDIVDVATVSQATKFKYAVKRIGRKIDEFVLGLFGVNQAPDYHYPLYLAQTTTVLRAAETDNTGAAMYDESIPKAVTCSLVGSGGNHKFKGNFDRDSIIVGVSYYDVERLYYKGVDRSFMNVDRFDHFNSFMQFAGDQPLYSEEYDASLTDASATYFGYKPAYEELKEAINTADAGFVTALPGYAFLNDMEKNGGNNPGARANEHVSPDFIRSKPTEMDRFYKALSGYSLANYFHFIVIYNQEDEAKRPLVFNPGLAI